MQHERSRRPTRVTASQQCAIRIGQGPVRGDKVYFVLARGGVYTQGPMQQLNFQDPYLRASLGLIGLNDIEVITVEGVAFGPEAADKAVSAALARVSAIAA